MYMELVEVAEIGNGLIKKVIISDRELAVTKIGNGYVVFDDTCTHEYCSLSDGATIEEFEITCPCHGGKFDLKSGDATALPAVRPLTVYKTMVEDGKIWVDL